MGEGKKIKKNKEKRKTNPNQKKTPQPESRNPPRASSPFAAGGARSGVLGAGGGGGGTRGLLAGPGAPPAQEAAPCSPWLPLPWRGSGGGFLGSVSRGGRLRLKPGTPLRLT